MANGASGEGLQHDASAVKNEQLLNVLTKLGGLGYSQSTANDSQAGFF